MMTLTAKRFVECAWLLDLRIVSADSNLIDRYFIPTATTLALQKGVDVQYIDFSCYSSPEAALESNMSFLMAIEASTQPRLLWFDNCDCLAPLDCSLTFTLRSQLTALQSNNIQSVFVARQSSLDQMFGDKEAAFYQSNFPITNRHLKSND